jgi:protoporphyrinogen oxidase
MKVAVVGGGAAGLSSAFRLSLAGACVRVYESGSTLGGLAGSFLLGGEPVEKFYHFVCLNDREYLDTLGELRVSHKMRWRLTDMGQFINGELHPFGRPIDLLTFPLLSWREKARLAAGIMKIKRAPWGDWKKIENVPVLEWLRECFGAHVCKALHEPLVRMKFGSYSDRLSASWMWARIHRLGKSRTRFRQREKIGYLEGGSQFLMNRLGEEISKHDGAILMDSPVDRLLIEGQTVKGLVVNGREETFDCVVSTIPLPAFLRLIPDSTRGAYWQKLRNIVSIGVRCVFLRTSQGLTRFFWTNISDPNIPLAGVIQFTNLNPLPHLRGDHVIYLPQYMPANTEEFRKPDRQVIAECLGYLKQMNPQFSEGSVKTALVFREQYAQPICEIGFTKDMPDIRTPLRGLYLTDSSQLHPDDRTISNSLGLGRRAARLVLEDAPRCRVPSQE